MDISAWCGDYLNDPTVQLFSDMMKQKAQNKTRELAGTLPAGQSVIYTDSRTDEIYIHPTKSIYSFGNGLFHSQSVSCFITSDGCCARGECSLSYTARDYFKDPIDLCQRFGMCGVLQNVGGVPFWFGLKCTGSFSTFACRK